MDKDNPKKFETLQEEPINIPEKPINLGTPAHPSPNHLPKKIALILTIFIFTILIIGGIYIFINLKDDQASISNLINPTAILTPTIESSANWKTYEDEILSFEYPPNLFIDPKDKNGWVNFLKEKNNKFSSVLDLSYNADSYINIGTLKKCSELDPNKLDYDKCLKDKNNINPIKTRIVHGKVGEEFTILLRGPAVDVKIFQIKNPAVVFYPQGSKLSESDFENIITSLKFN